MNGSFFALLSRMKYISRWGLMRNSRTENIAEHSLEVAMITHLLCELRNRRFGGSVDVSKAVLAAVYHDVPEIITGDLPTPVKYYDPEIKSAYKRVENAAVEKLLSTVPDDLRGDYAAVFDCEQDPEIARLVKAADKLSALIKCVEERRSGNTDFAEAERQTLESVKNMHLKEADAFIEEFLPSYGLTLDEQTR